MSDTRTIDDCEIGMLAIVGRTGRVSGVLDKNGICDLRCKAEDYHIFFAGGTEKPVVKCSIVDCPFRRKEG